jgi:methionine sulfoxide reductase heme-binding subunit
MTFLGESTYWYLARGSGIVSLALFTIAVSLGLLTAGRMSTARWPRFVTESLHRNVSLASVVFLAIHIVSIVLDDYVSIGLVEAFVPFVGTYSPFYLGMGALAFDIILMLAITGVLRTTMPFRVWRLIHWMAYLGWPIAVVHTVGIGTDQLWSLVTVGAGIALVLTCGGYRAVSVRRRSL